MGGAHVGMKQIHMLDSFCRFMSGRSHTIMGCLAFAMIALTVRPCAAQEVLYFEDFTGKDGAKIEAFGWERKGGDDHSTWEIKDGSLKTTCFFKPYNGGSISRVIPYVSRGELSFDVNINAGGNQGYEPTSAWSSASTT